jgi:hypothetical protein
MAAQRGDEHHHEVGREAPDRHHDDGGQGRGVAGEPVDPAGAEGGQELVHEAVGVQQEAPYQADGDDGHDVGQEDPAHAGASAGHRRADGQGQQQGDERDGVAGEPAKLARPTKRGDASMS